MKSNKQPILVSVMALSVGLGGMSSLIAAPIFDDFSGGLGNWTETVILDNVDPGTSNTSTWQVNGSGHLELDTTVRDTTSVEQWAYIRSGATLAIGEEAQVTLPNWPLTGGDNNESFGVYIGGTAPAFNVRQDYIAVYGKRNNTGTVFQRGFDGTSEYTNLTLSGQTNVTKLFIARIAANEYEWGAYDGATRTPHATVVVPITPNSADVVGIYADVRSVATILAVESFEIVMFPYVVEMADTDFQSGLPLGGTVGTLYGGFGPVPTASTFSLVAGTGDTDNLLFDIVGDELVVDADFSSAGLDPASGTQYFVRVRGDSDGGPDFSETELVLTVTKDDDLDNLPDEWELMWAANLTDLSAASGTEDFDGDQLWDIEEYQISIGAYAGFPALPTIDPTKADTDGDGLNDGEETIFLVGARPITNPVEPDSDFDGLTDFEETNSGGAETPPMVGTSGTIADTDGDGAKDGHEIDNGTDPLLDTSSPASVSPSVTVTPITDDASTGISVGKTYTHKISGGFATTVNGVSFDALDTTTTPANFDWTPTPAAKSAITTANLGSWVPATGLVTGTESIDLLSGFTFANGVAPPGGTQTYTLSGLTPGSDYELNIYTRAWSPATDSGRAIDLTFTNGSEVVQPWCSIAMDRPGFVLGTNNHDNAYFITFSYTAQGTELVIEAPMPLGADAGTGGYDTLHLYGLTNELTGSSGVAPKITDVFFDSGDLKITFTPGGAGYILTSANDLAPPYTEETNAVYDNVDTFTVPAAFLDPGDDYFRVEKP